MPIDIYQFERGDEVKRKVVQKNIVKILKANPSIAISAIELENALDIRRQSTHSALRSLEEKGIIERAFIKEGKRYVIYARLRKEYVTRDVEELFK